MLKLSLLSDGIKNHSLGKRPGLDKILRGAHGDSLLSFSLTMSGHSQKAGIDKAGRGPSPGPDHARTPIWHLQLLALGETDVCC